MMTRLAVLLTHPDPLHEDLVHDLQANPNRMPGASLARLAAAVGFPLVGRPLITRT
jgi:hypothetical protein